MLYPPASISIEYIVGAIYQMSKLVIGTSAGA